MRLIIAALLLASAASPSTASATVTFGGDLSLTPDLSFHCSLPPPFFGPYTLPDTCTAYTAGVFGGGNVRGSDLVPDGTGEITKLRLREPNVASSPLKLTVLRSIRTPQSTIAACCTVAAESQPFTPLPNQITEVVFNPPIPVHSITTATGVYEYDGIALTATDANSVIPAATAAGHSSGAYYPAAQVGQERNEQQTSLGTNTQILFEADWEPVASGSPSTPGSATPNPSPTGTPTTAPLIISGGTFTTNRSTIPIVCALTTICKGTLKLLSGAPGGTQKTVAAPVAKVKKPTLYGTAHFTVAAGKGAQIKVGLNAAGRAKVKHKKKLTLYASATIGSQVTTTKLTLRAH